MAIEKAPSQIPASGPIRAETSEQGLERLTEEERKLHSLLIPAHKRSAIELSKFEGLYDKNMITEDAAYVERMEKRFKERENPKLAYFQRKAELLEAIVREEIKRAGWLGPEVLPVTASRYDDIKNGVDLVVEFLKKEGVNRLALSVDVTSNVTSLEEKLRKIRDNILEGHLTQVKYFISSDGNRQEIRNIPRVVVGTEGETIKELSEIRLEIHTCVNALKKSKEKDGLSAETEHWYKSRGMEARDRLVNHRVQILILDEVQIQVEAFADFARKNNRDDLAAEYEKALDTIRKIKEGKRSLNEAGLGLSPRDSEANNSDGVYKALRVGLGIFK